jgi:ketosteroid isomerase-like protein
VWLIDALISLSALVSGGRSELAKLPAAPCDAPGPPTDEVQLETLVRESVAASQRRDLPAYVATLDPDAPLFDAAANEAARAFAEHDLDYQIVDLRVLVVKGDKATVAFGFAVRSRGNDDFANQVVTGVLVARRRQGKWKLRETRAIGSVPLATRASLSELRARAREDQPSRTKVHHGDELPFSMVTSVAAAAGET